VRVCGAAVAAFTEPEKYRNQFIPVYDQYMSCEEMVKVFTEVTGLKARRARRLLAFPASHTSSPTWPLK